MNKKPNQGFLRRMGIEGKVSIFSFSLFVLLVIAGLYLVYLLFWHENLALAILLSPGIISSIVSIIAPAVGAVHLKWISFSKQASQHAASKTNNASDVGTPVSNYRETEKIMAFFAQIITVFSGLSLLLMISFMYLTKGINGFLRDISWITLIGSGLLLSWLFVLGKAANEKWMGFYDPHSEKGETKKVKIPLTLPPWQSPLTLIRYALILWGFILSFIMGQSIKFGN